MKKIRILMLFLICLISNAFAKDALHSIDDVDDITYDWLVLLGKETGYTDHIQHFKEIFSKFKVNTLLEFGLGFSTKYFLESCNRVISVEFVTHELDTDWIKKCLVLYEDYYNWIPITYFTSFQGDNS